MRVGLQIAIVASMFTVIMTAIGYVLLVQLNKADPIKMEELTKNITPIFSFGIFIFIVMAGTNIFLIHSITNPVKKLRHAVDKIARGDLYVKIYPKENGEVRVLAISFKTIVNTLRKSGDL